MHPRTDELLRHLDANRVVLLAAVDSVTPELRETRPSPDRWSVAEILEHLTRVEQQITRFLSTKLTEAKAAGQLSTPADTSPISASLSHEAVIDRSRAFIAGERVIPRGEMDSSTALAALESARAQLRDVVIGVDGLDLGSFVLPHPAIGPINGYQWFLFLGSHEARHAAQIREIGSR